jgi:hypothetical protein
MLWGGLGGKTGGGFGGVIGPGFAKFPGGGATKATGFGKVLPATGIATVPGAAKSKFSKLPGALGGFPGALGGFPGALGGFPGALGGFPGALGGFPGALGGFPGALGKAPFGGISKLSKVPGFFSKFTKPAITTGFSSVVPATTVATTPSPTPFGFGKGI